MTTCAGTKPEPLWWQEHAWNQATFDFLGMFPQESLVALDQILDQIREGKSIVAPPVEALPSLIGFLQEMPAKDEKSFFSIWEELASRPDRWNLQTSLPLGFLLNLAPWTAEEAEAVLESFCTEADLGYSNAVTAHLQAGSVETKLIDLFFSNPHLPSLEGSTTRGWFYENVTQPLLTARFDSFQGARNERRIELGLLSVVSNPGVALEDIEEIFVYIERKADDLNANYKDLSTETEWLLSQVMDVKAGYPRNNLSLGSLTGLKRRLDEDEARRLMTTESDPYGRQHLFQLFLGDSSLEHLARELFREFLRDSRRRKKLLYGSSLLGAALHELYKGCDFSVENVPLEWVLEVVS